MDKEKDYLLLTKELKEYLRKERSLSDIEKTFDLSSYEVGYVISVLKKNGYDIVENKHNDDISFINFGERNIDGDNEYVIKTNERKILLLSDTRFGSKYAQLSLTNDAYLKAHNEGIKIAFHMGDITEGLYSVKSKFRNSLFLTTTEEQARYVIDNYPYIEGMTTYFITGDQDYTHVTTNGIDIGRLISSNRDDMIYVGYGACRILIEKAKILMYHSLLERVYTQSYRQQQFIQGMRSEDKIDVILNGQNLVLDELNMRGIEEVSVGSLVSTTPRIAKRNYQHSVGTVNLELNLDDKGRFINAVPEFNPYYQTIKNDFCKTKKLVIRGKNNE